MEQAKYVLIGGGLASCEAIRGIREHDEDGEIALVGAEERLPYHRPPLSKSLMQDEKEEDEIYCEPKEFYDSQGVKLFLGRTAEAIHRQEKTVRLDDNTSLRYNKLLLATGGNPVKPSFDGARLDSVYYLRTVDESLAIREKARKSQRAVVIGAGFIGMELSASLTELGVEVTTVEAKDTIWPRFASPELAQGIQQYYEEKGVRFITGDQVAEIREQKDTVTVVMNSGRELLCDFVCCVVGVLPAVAIAEEADLKVSNGVVVDEQLVSSDPDILAAGDIANFPDPYFSRRRRVEHWGQAEYTGNLAGEVMAGGEAAYDLMTYVWSDGFDLHYEFAGDDGEFDDAVMRGTVGEPNCIAFHIRDKKMCAFLAVNPDEETLSVLEDMVEQQVSVADRRDELADEDVELTDFIED